MAARTTVAPGNWTTSGTWDTPPTTGDTVTINHAVTLNTTADIGTSTPGGTALTLNASLTISTGSSLTLRGNVIQGNFVTVTCNGAGQIIFDPTTSPSGTSYNWQIGTGPESGADPKVVIRGTSGSRFRVSTAIGGTPCRFTAGVGSYSKGGQIDAEYTDFIRIGDSNRFAFNPTGPLFRLFHCVLFRCGRLARSRNGESDVVDFEWADSTFTLDNCVLIESTSNPCIEIHMAEASSTGAVRIASSDIDDSFTLYGYNGVTLTSNVYRSGWADASNASQPATAGPYPATYIAISGPTGGLPDVDSTAFTVALAGGTTVSGTVTVTPAATGAGSFTPTSVGVTTAAPSITFTYHPPAGDAIHTISVTNNGVMPGVNGTLLDPITIAYSASVSATTYTLTGPTSGVAGRRSDPYIVALNPSQTVSTPVTITFSDGGAGGTFNPPSVTLAANIPGAFGSSIYTAPSGESANRTISTTSGGRLTDPASITFAAGRSYARALTVWGQNLSGTAGGQGGVYTNYVTLNGPPNPFLGLDYGNHYDPILAYQNIRDRTGNSAWDEAVFVARYQYRDLYLVPVSYAAPSYHINTEGMRRDYEREGLWVSRDAVIILTQDGLGRDQGIPVDPNLYHNIYSREMAFALLCRLDAERMGTIHSVFCDYWKATLLDIIKQWYDPGNSWYFTTQNSAVIPCAACQPFMLGLVCRSLIRYWDRYRDSSIPPLIKMALDGVWSRAWWSNDLTFPYFDRDTTAILAAHPECGSYDGTNNSPQYALNPLVGPGYAWYANYTTDPAERTIYLNRYEDIFRGSSSSGGYVGDMQSNTQKEYIEAHLWEELGFKWWERLVNPPAAATTYTLQAPSPASGQANRASDRFRVSLIDGTGPQLPIVITPHDGTAGGSFIPPTVYLTSDEPTHVFRYVPPATSEGIDQAISTTNNQGLTDPAPVTYAVRGVATIATAISVTVPAQPNAPDRFSPPITIALDPPGSVPPRTADARGGIIQMRASDNWLGGEFDQNMWCLSAEQPSFQFRYNPNGYTGARTLYINYIPVDVGLPVGPGGAGTVTYTANSGAPATTPATTYLMTGPSPASGPIWEDSGSFVISLPPNTYIPSRIPVALSSGDGGSFDPPYFLLMPGDPTFTTSFTFQPTDVGAYTIQTTNGATLSDPAGFAYAAYDVTPSLPTPNTHGRPRICHGSPGNL